MLSLKNEALEVTLLDPNNDRERFGTRYCTGGYIFQIADTTHGPLLTGPTYPESFNTYDGQGIPDAFNLYPLKEPASDAKEVLVIGVGLCDLAENRVLRFSPWEIEQEEGAVRMKTAQQFQRYALELKRTVRLADRSVESAIRLGNTGVLMIPVRWFPHPFFPQPESSALCRFNIPIQFSDNPGYEWGDDGYLHRKTFPDQIGHYLPLNHDAQSKLVVLQRHPKLGLVAASFSYVPDFFPIWGNQHTFSFEPFFERSVAPGQEIHWGIKYDF